MANDGSSIDIKRYKEIDDTTLLTATTVVQTTFSEMATVTQPAVLPVEPNPNTAGKVLMSNMGLDVAAGMDKTIQHFCIDCGMPYRQSRMIRFRGLWYGIPCGCYVHAVDIFRKEKQRAYRPARVNEPGAVPFVKSTNW